MWKASFYLPELLFVVVLSGLCLAGSISILIIDNPLGFLGVALAVFICIDWIDEIYWWNEILELNH